MEEEQQTGLQTAQQSPSGKKFEWNKLLIGLGIFTVILIIGVIFYLLGKQNSTQSKQTPTPTPLTPITQQISPTQIPQIPSPTTLPSPTPTPKILTKTLSSLANLDGFESSNGGGNTSLDIRAGRNTNLVTRGFIGFDLSSLPDGVTVTGATLRVYQAKTVGNPYGVGGNLMIDHLNYGNSLENVDYSTVAILSNFATLSTDAAVQWKEVEVMERVQSDVDEARAYSQFRIHFTSENKGGDVAGDFVYFEAKDNSEGTGNTPELVIKYY